MKLALTLIASLVAAAPLLAEPITFESGDTPATLLELFTSEGCSSCPPADAWMSKLKASPDLWKRVVPVVFHVDYWDRLGWPDRFATAANTARQHRYAAAWRGNSVYTPGFVLNGREWRDWFNRGALPAPASGKVGKLTVTFRGAKAEVSFGRSAAGELPPLLAELALLGGNFDSDVKRGENSGRKLRHDFVVLHLATAALTFDGKGWTASFSLPEKKSDAATALAAWVTTGEAQPPIQATGGWISHK